MMRTVSVDEYYLSEQDEATVLRQLGALGTSAMPPAPAGQIVVAARDAPGAPAVRSGSNPGRRDARLPLVA